MTDSAVRLIESRAACADPGTEGTRALQSANAGGREDHRVAARYRRLLMVLPGGVIVLDGNGIVQECNPAAQDLLGVALLGQPWREVVVQCFHPRADDGHDMSLRNGRRVNISTQALDDECGQILLLKDVTETRQLQDEVGRHRRLAAMGEMAAALAHQIRTPLSAAILYLSNLVSAPLLDATKRQRFTAKALARLRHLEQLVNQMLLYARAGTFDMEVLQLGELLDDLQRLNTEHIRSKQLTLSVSNPVSNVELRGNRAALISVLSNLVDNAMQASEGHCSLRVTTQYDSSSHVVIDFTDAGPGIPEELRETVFEPFMTTRAQGNGLGLAVAQAVIQAHGGRLSLETVAPTGATFRLRLPVVVAKQDTPAIVPTLTKTQWA